MIEKKFDTLILSPNSASPRNPQCKAFISLPVVDLTISICPISFRSQIREYLTFAHPKNTVPSSTCELSILVNVPPSIITPSPSPDPTTSQSLRKDHTPTSCFQAVLLLSFSLLILVFQANIAPNTFNSLLIILLSHRSSSPLSHIVTTHFLICSCKTMHNVSAVNSSTYGKVIQKEWKMFLHTR